MPTVAQRSHGVSEILGQGRGPFVDCDQGVLSAPCLACSTCGPHWGIGPAPALPMSLMVVGLCGKSDWGAAPSVSLWTLACIQHLLGRGSRGLVTLCAPSFPQAQPRDDAEISQSSSSRPSLALQRVQSLLNMHFCNILHHGTMEPVISTETASL